MVETDFFSFIENKSQYYASIDIERMPRIWAEVHAEFSIDAKVVHIIGTNGKGSTGRMLAHLLWKQGKRVGHFSSPHILSIRERYWSQGEDATDTDLNRAHRFLLDKIPSDFIEEMSYFEYTTLMAFHLFGEMEYMILEAGLGGEYDATNVLPKTLSLVTPIDYDHQEYLGDTIEKISTTKLNSINNPALLGLQKHTEVYVIADKISVQKGWQYQRCEEMLSTQERERTTHTIRENAFPPFQVENLMLACGAVKFFSEKIVLEDLKEVSIKGRCQKLSDNVTIDVGHNPLAAQAILRQYRGKKVNLIYNCLNDKDYQSILKILFPIIKVIYFIDIDSQRAQEKVMLEKFSSELGLHVRNFDTIAYDQREEYLVFGSFVVAETFMKQWTMHAR